MRLEAGAWLMLAIALGRVYVYISETLAGPGQGLWFFFSSDTVQYGLIYRDLFEDGFHFGGWNISHAPEYIQMLSALFLRRVAGTLTGGHVLEALTQPVLLALALRFTLSRLWPRAAALGPAIVVIILALISQGLGVDFIAFIWSNRHGYTAILAILGLGLLIGVLGGQGRKPLLGLVVAAGVASDLLFFVWFVVPALATVLLLRQSAGAGRTRSAVGAISIGALVGQAVFWALTPVSTVGSKLGIQPEAAWAALHRIADGAFGWSPELTAVSLVTVAGFLTALVVAFRVTESGPRAAGVYVVCMGLMTVVAVAATAAPFREAGYTRYLLAPQVAGLVVLSAALYLSFGRWGAGFLAATLAVAILPGLRWLPASVPPPTEYYPPLVSCLDEVARRHRLQYGVADYWLAKYVTALSRSGLRVMAVTPRLDPFVNFTNIEWFLGGVGARRHDRPAYTFAILGANRPQDPGVSPSALAAFGPPVAVESCDGFEVRILPDGADERIRSQFKENPRIKAYYSAHGLALPPN